MPSILTWDMETYYESAGEGQPIVLIHGFTLDQRLWTPQWKVFSRVARAVRYDLRGHGESSAPSTGYTVQALAMQLRTFLDGLGISRPVIIGHSFGAAVALHFALQHRTRVAALVLANPEVWGAPIPDDSFYQGKSAPAFDPGPLVDPKVGKKSLQAWLQSEVFAATRKNEPAFRAIETIVLAHGCAPWAQMQDKPAKYPDDFSEIASLDVPLLVLSGAEDDAYFRGVARSLGEKVPGARLVEIPDTGHVTNMERPVEFNRHVLEFLNACGLIGPLVPGIEVPPRPHKKSPHRKERDREKERERKRGDDQPFYPEELEEMLEFPEETPHYAEERPQHPQEMPEPPQERPERPQERPQSPQERPQSPQERPQRPQERPRRPDERPRRPDERPRRPDERPRRPDERPRRPDERPRRPDERPRRPDERPRRPDERPRRPDERPRRPDERPRRPDERPRRPDERPRRPDERPQRPQERPQRPGERPQRPQERPQHPQRGGSQPTYGNSEHRRRRRRRRPSDEPGGWKPRPPTAPPPKEEKQGFWSKLFGKKRKKGEEE